MTDDSPQAKPPPGPACNPSPPPFPQAKGFSPSAQTPLGERGSGLLNRQEELELGGKLLLGVKAVREIDPPYAAVCVDLNSQGLDVVGTVRPAGEVREVELDLVPSLVKSHRHCADEGLHSGRGLVVGGSEAAPDIFVIKNLNFESEILLQVLNNHDKKRKFDTKRFARIRWTYNIAVANVCAHYLQHAGLNVSVRDTLQMPVPHLLFPYFKRFRANTVKYG
eukprot:CAMPEP_0177602144 /NCGR_PEP_ID=MMETSP0419_2-20121207/14697_1 /TAXON_ID=582737 /ORGANISM="Tetraselmis sp., Strain GSL018" /LENGTH=221 /DNA_ID=CAMNT_0019095579 /DNA_START=234 /DNA_END=899 /DNA_ORIENTATION=-